MRRNSVLSRRSFPEDHGAGGGGIGGGGVADSRSAAGPAAAELPIQQAPLPFADTALEPFISAKTFSFHYGKHHKAYVDKANELLKGSPLAARSIPEIIQATAGNPSRPRSSTTSRRPGTTTSSGSASSRAAAGRPAASSATRSRPRSAGSTPSRSSSWMRASRSSAAAGRGW